MKRTLVALIEGYRRCLSPYLGRNCRFHPTCSAYAVEAIQKKGAAKGLLLAAWRILRCNPWNRNCGFDPVK